jgi:hypothetical protein
MVNEKNQRGILLNLQLSHALRHLCSHSLDQPLDSPPRSMDVTVKGHVFSLISLCNSRVFARGSRSLHRHSCEVDEVVGDLILVELLLS